MAQNMGTNVIVDKEKIPNILIHEPEIVDECFDNNTLSGISTPRKQKRKNCSPA